MGTVSQANFEASVEMANDKTVMQCSEQAVPITDSFVLIDDYTSYINGSLSSVSGGVFTAGRAGVLIISAEVSFESVDAGAPDVTMSFFKNGSTDTTYGIERDISAIASIGSGAGGHAVAMEVGDTLEMKIKRVGGSDGDLLFHTLFIKTEWQS